MEAARRASTSNHKAFPNQQQVPVAEQLVALALLPVSLPPADASNAGRKAVASDRNGFQGIAWPDWCRYSQIIAVGSMK